MFRNITKKILAGVMLASFFLIDNVANAYDLPEIKIEKPKKSTKNKTTTEKNDKTKKSVPLMDKNYIFIGKYKGMNYYLDRYSIKINRRQKNSYRAIRPVNRANCHRINGGDETFLFGGRQERTAADYRLGQCRIQGGARTQQTVTA